MSRVRIETRAYVGDPARHVHGFAQAIWPLDGEMTVSVGLCAQRATPETALLIGPRTAHAFEAAPDCRFLVMDIAAPEIIHRWLTRPICARPIDAATRRYLGFLAGETSVQQRSPLATLPAAAATAFELLDAHVHARPCSDRSWADRGLIARLADCRARLAADCQGTLCIDELADTAGLSPRQFHRRFRAQFDETPKQVQLAARLGWAAERLVENGMTIDDIAAACGYSEAATFARAFSRRYGQAPGRYRVAADGKGA